MIEEFRRFDKKTLENRINFLKKSFHKIGVTFRPPSIEWDMVQAILSRYDKSLFDFLIDVELEGGNLGAFKKVLRTYNKRGLLPDFENLAIAPFDNIKAKNLIFYTVICESDDLKISRKSTIQRP